VGFVIQQLREGIIRGRFAPGQRLLTSELMDEIGVSRGTLREAFNHLASDGLVDLVPNRGATVRRLSRSELVELFRIREVLEGLAARQAAEAIDKPGNRAHFERMWEQARVDATPLTAATFTEKNNLFHHALVAISGNSQLARLIDKLQLPLLMPRLSYALTPADIESSMQEHVPVAEAILAGAPDAADIAMRKHLRDACQRILRMSTPLLKPEKSTWRNGR
jgi:DNA-binding GntR family transcriptional regulator